jgi:hypothetical protein
VNHISLPGWAHVHVIAHGDDLATRIEDGTRVVAAFFNVGRKGCAV